MATVLQQFNIQKKKDASGKEIEVDGGYTDGFAMYVLWHVLNLSEPVLTKTQHREPLPFECAIVPRSAESQQMILDAVAKEA